MTWFAFSGLNNGQAINLAGSQEKQAVIEGFHGYGTEAEAESHPNSVNIVTRYLADTWIADYNAAVKEQAAPGQANANILNPVTAVKAGATGVVNSIPGLSGILGIVSSRQGWIRIAEVIIGCALVVVAVAELAKGTPVGDAAGKAAKVAKLA